MGDPNDAGRRAALGVHRRHLEAAAEVGAALYVLHPDYCLTPIERSAAVRDALQRSIVELEALQAEYGVEVAVENLAGADHTHFARPGDLDLGDLGLALDTGHAAACGALEDFLRAPQGRLRHVHLHDNPGPLDGATGPDPHLALGLGVVDASAVLAAARRAGAAVIIEVLTPDGVAASLDYLRREGLVGAALASPPPACAVARFSCRLREGARDARGPVAAQTCDEMHTMGPFEVLSRGSGSNHRKSG